LVSLPRLKWLELMNKGGITNRRLDFLQSSVTS
jgi:hypothetical protein